MRRRAQPVEISRWLSYSPSAGRLYTLRIMRNMARRDFLKSVPAAAGVAAFVTRAQTTTAARPGDVKISGTSYTPVADYPIQPKRYSEVTLTDNFWRPKVATNATVTIPF